MTDMPGIERAYERATSSREWSELEKMFKKHREVYLVCHGGNLSIARHIATDLTRLTGGKKLVYAPDTDTVSIWHGDFDYTRWLVDWLSPRLSEQTVMPLVVGLSSSGSSPDIDKALQFASDLGCDTCYITSQPVNNDWGSLEVVTGVTHYYMSEIMMILLCHRLMNSSGVDSPMIKTVNHKQPEEPRLHSFGDETYQIGVDFDGVIHKCSKGYHDGTIYDDPVEGSKEALQRLSEKYTVIVNTCKARMDRGLVNGKTGVELVWEWLENHDLAQYVSKVTAEKPRAIAYVDDKAVRFHDWIDVLESMEALGVIEKERAR